MCKCVCILKSGNKSSVQCAVYWTSQLCAVRSPGFVQACIPVSSIYKYNSLPVICVAHKHGRALTLETVHQSWVCCVMLGWRGRFHAWMCENMTLWWNGGSICAKLNPTVLSELSLRDQCIEMYLTFFPRDLLRVKICDSSSYRQASTWFFSWAHNLTASLYWKLRFFSSATWMLNWSSSSVWQFSSHFLLIWPLRWNFRIFCPCELPEGGKTPTLSFLMLAVAGSGLQCAECTGCSLLTQVAGAWVTVIETRGIVALPCKSSWFSGVLCWSWLCLKCWVHVQLRIFPPRVVLLMLEMWNPLVCLLVNFPSLLKLGQISDKNFYVLSFQRSQVVNFIAQKVTGFFWLSCILWTNFLVVLLQ